MKAYILESSLSLILLFGLYWFLLRKEKLFVFNRYFLIISVILSLIFPFVSIPVHFHASVNIADFVAKVSGAENPLAPVYIPVHESATVQFINPGSVPASDQQAFKSDPAVPGISSTLPFIYTAGLLLFFLRFLHNLRRLFLQSRSNEKVFLKGYRIVLIRDQINPYCFFKTIFLNRDDYLRGGIDRVLFDHELQHVKQCHTIDIIFIELIRIFYWFNPVLLLYRNAMKVNHEYLADSCAGSGYYDIKSYSEKLLSRAFRNAPLASGFNRSLIRKRLLMITKPENGKARSGMIIASAFLLIALFTGIMSFKPVNGPPVKMIFVPYEEYDTTKFMETGRTFDVITYSDGFYMSNEITNKAYREFTDWVKSNPDETVARRNDIIRQSTNPVTGKVRQIIFHIPEIRSNSDILDELIDSAVMDGLDKRYENYFTDPEFDDYPVVGVSAEMAEFYCGWKGKSEALIKDTIIDGERMSLMAGRKNYRLPTEKEWEHALKFSGRKGAGKPGKRLKAVTTENQSGLAHLNDNVSEWIVNPDDTTAIVRGGSWKTRREVYRRITNSDTRDAYTGFRVVSVDKKRLTETPARKSLQNIKLQSDSSVIPADRNKTSFQQYRRIPGTVTAKNGKQIHAASIRVKADAEQGVKLQQKGTIRGIVTGENDIPLAGVAVVIKGENKGAMTDINGKFSLSDVPEEKVLMISSHGYITQEARAETSGELRIRLIKDQNSGVRESSDSWRGARISEEGLYDNIKGLVLQENGEPVAGVTVNISTELVRAITDRNGRFLLTDVPENSLIVFAREGYYPWVAKADFTSDMIITLRKDPGYSGKSDSNESFLDLKTNPLYIVDGEIKTKAELPKPDAISSLSLLRGSSATAVFGEKGINGVIIITTKKKSGLMKIDGVEVIQSLDDSSKNPGPSHGFDNMPIIEPDDSGKMKIVKPDSTVIFR